MRATSSRGSTGAGALATGLILCLTACSGVAPARKATSETVTPSNPPHPVDVCSLLPTQVADELLGTHLVQVGGAYQPPTLPTYRCDFGTHFGQPLVAVQLTIGPVARNIFDRAYGASAGGDPKLITDLGDWAYLRRENSIATLAVFTLGSVASIAVTLDEANPIDDDAVKALASRMVARLPENPALAAAPQSRRCAAVDPAAVNAILAGPPTLMSGIALAHGSLMCSWAGQPGNVIVRQTYDAGEISKRVPALSDSNYVSVDLSAAAPEDQVTAWSRVDVPGDLVILVGSGPLVDISVMPPAGFSDDGLATTAGETTLAKAVLAALTRPSG